MTSMISYLPKNLAVSANKLKALLSSYFQQQSIKTSTRLQLLAFSFIASAAISILNMGKSETYICLHV